ncbi:MMPL family transporter [Hymenobacter weizhouensis]|uniref:MMPL family transporter n=1 Tax=Hymenobacter sp. YIM 151500-1 TaxID=2987689 RepID=UPI002226A097|nr:MMPL family transporter [Hymenobacter sp. YIM 151500-1]UYZ65179.1 MMPL family transporter [Hymenobacter sp. YIM 151500-1]
MRRRGHAPATAHRTTVAHVGPTIVLSSAVLCAGYLVLTLASLKTVVLFGVLTATAIAAAFYAELFVFPLLLARFDSEPPSRPEVAEQPH